MAVSAVGKTAAADLAGQLAEIERLRRERGAVILAHNYQIPAVQDLADFVGDSLGLSQAAARTDAEVIVFCGVHFMAETAAILCPDKAVLLPDLEAGCSLAATIRGDDVRRWKAEHPGAVVVAYVNTTAEVKAEADYCCTSSNAVKVVEAIPPEREILFLPDMFLGLYVQRVTGRANIRLWLGECHVHAGIRPADVQAMRTAHPEADFLIHPECGCASSYMYHVACGDLSAEGTHVLSTEGMIRHSKDSPAETFVVATEVGVLHRMKKENPRKRFLPVSEAAVCQYMKKIDVPKVLWSLQHLQHRVVVPPPVARRARRAIERMLELA